MSSIVKDKSGPRIPRPLADNLSMLANPPKRPRSERPPAAKEWASGFCARLQTARKRAGVKQQAIAKLLGCELGTYKKYEYRTPLPQHLIPVACVALRIPSWWLLTGLVEEPHLTATLPELPATGQIEPFKRLA